MMPRGGCRGFSSFKCVTTSVTVATMLRDTYSPRTQMDSHIAPVKLEEAYRLFNHGPTVLVSASHDGVELFRIADLRLVFVTGCVRPPSAVRGLSR